MTVDIWIMTNHGAELHKENLSWSEACAEICNEYILEKLEEELTSGLIKDFIHEEIVGVLENENNTN